MKALSFIVVSFIIVTSAWSESTTASLTAGDILKKVDEVEKYDNFTSEMTQVITTSDDNKRTLKITGWATNTGDKQLSEYTYPKRVAGVKILMLNDGDDIWSFSPRTRRTRHLASHAKKQKVMGSDFTYEDMGGGKMSEKYSGIVLKEETYEDVLCYVLDLTPTPKGPSYDKIIAWVGKNDFAARKVDFYQDGGTTPFKTLYLKDIQKIDGHLIAMEMTMKNNEDGGVTYNKITKADFNSAISDKKFNSETLDRK